MANQLYDAGREGILDESITCKTGVLKWLAVRGYTPNLGAHKFVSDITGAGGTIVATSPAIASKTFTAGVLNAGVATFSSVPLGPAITALVLIQSSAAGGGADVAASAQRVIGFMDTGNSSSLPVTPNGGNITVTPDTGANHIFKL
ncbi:MAG: hypothetical protein ACJ74O_13400 [Frankiaceae bacterium]|jgi:hypothetical protein